MWRYWKVWSIPSTFPWADTHHAHTLSNHIHKHTPAYENTYTGETTASVCVCLHPHPLQAGSRPKQVLTSLMGFHTPKYTHVHTLGHTVMLKMKMSEGYVWSQTNKPTHTCVLSDIKGFVRLPHCAHAKLLGSNTHTEMSLLLFHFQSTWLHAPAGHTEQAPRIVHTNSPSYVQHQSCIRVFGGDIVVLSIIECETLAA